MTEYYRKVKRISDGTVFETIRYGNPDGSWDKECISKIAAFVLGFDPDIKTTVGNERILDIVRPVISEFDPINFKAPIEIVDPKHGGILRVELGDWILKDNSSLSCFKNYSSFASYEEAVPGKVNVINETNGLVLLSYSLESYESFKEAD